MPTHAIRLVFLFACCATIFVNTSTAQTKQETETREMYFPITKIEKLGKDTIAAAIAGGRKYGLKKGLTGPVKGSYKKGNDRSSLEIGFASLVTLDDNNAWVLVRPSEKTGKDYEVRIGDYVKLNITIPKLAYHSVFFELALQDIRFKNIYDKPLYSFELLMNSDSKQLEDSLLNASAKDVAETYEGIKNDTNWKKLYQPMDGGRFAGKSVFDMMRDCTPKDVATFLNYVSYYPKFYTGNTWMMSETFATWVMGKPSYTKQEVYDSILAYKSRPLLQKQFIQKNLVLIKDNGFVVDWVDDASTALNKNREQDANNLFYVAYTLLPYEQNDCYTAYYYHNYAELHEKKKEYQKELQCCDTAYKYFTKCGNSYYQIETLFKKANTLSTMNRDDDALKVYDQAFSETKSAANNLKGNQVNDFSARYFYLSGILLYVKNDFKKAATYYDSAIALYKKMGNYAALQVAIKVQGRLARLYNKQGELSKALEIYNEQLAVYTKLNDRENIAEVLYNIADIEFDLAAYRKALEHYRESQKIHFDFKNLDDVALNESRIGQCYSNLGKYDSAIASHKTSISYRRQTGSKSGMAFSWKKLGSLYNNSGQKNEAFAAYDSAAYYYKITNDSARLRSLLSDIGDVYNNDNQYQKAFSVYKEWHRLNVLAKDKLEMCNSLYQLAQSSSNFDKDTATKYAQQTLVLSKEIGDKNNEYYANILSGSLQFMKYNYDQGSNYFRNALSIAVSQKNRKQEAYCYNMFGIANSNALRFDSAMHYLQSSKAIYQSLNERSKLPNLFRNIGACNEAKGEFYEARKYYQQSIDTSYAINSRADVGYGYNSLVFMHIIQGELKKAEQFADSAYEIFRGLNNNWQMAAVYFNKGLVHEAKADGINAIRFYSMADSMYKIEKDIYSQSTCKTNIGAVFYYQADYAKGLAYFQEADRLLNSINTVTEAHILAPINIGESYYFMKDYAKAEPYLVKGYKMANEKNAGRMKTISSSFLGTLYYDLKKYDLSEKYLLEGFALAQKSNETDLYINSGMYLGKLYSTLNQPAKSQEYYARTVAFIKTIDNSKYTWMAYYEYGLNFYNNKQLDSAVTYFKKAVDIVENSSKNLFGGAEAKKIYSADERKVDLYNKLVASLAKLGNKEDALYYADKTNNQAVKEQMEKAGLVTNDKEKSEAIKKGGELLQKKNAVEQAIGKEKAKPEKEQNKQLIASLESVKNVAETDYTNFIEGLQKKYPDLQAYFSNTNPKDFRNYIEDIPDSTLVALYVVNDNQLLIFTVTNKETGIKTIELKQDINKQAAHFLSVLRNPKNATGTGAVTLRSTLKPVDDVRGDFKSEATDLYNLLITPISDQLKDKKNLCVITNGKLGSIPFQCLGIVDEKREFHFLVEDKAIFYTSKIDIFRKNFKNRAMQSSLAVLGNPDKSLPGATTEAKEIGKIIPTATVYVEEQATESKAIEGLQKYNYVHFATHGVLDYNNFEDSYLLFASDGNGNDGKLTIKEINGLTKQTNSLVVLSACETAVSKEEVKGWYISPANAFLTNRCDAVVGSFWKVPDETTNLLLQEFYKNISKGMSKVEALRNAQATVSQNPKYSHPFYWAAFLLYGEWR